MFLVLEIQHIAYEDYYNNVSTDVTARLVSKASRPKYWPRRRHISLDLGLDLLALTSAYMVFNKEFILCTKKIYITYEHTDNSATFDSDVESCAVAVILNVSLHCDLSANWIYFATSPDDRIQHWPLSNDQCLEDKRNDYQNCSVLYCVWQLCTMIRAQAWSVLKAECWFRLSFREFVWV